MLLALRAHREQSFVQRNPQLFEGKHWPQRSLDLYRHGQLTPEQGGPQSLPLQGFVPVRSPEDLA